MKHLFLFMLLFPMVLHAQIESKYDVGKVPMVNGKVVFSRDVTLPGQTQEQIYEAALKWANATFVPSEKFHSRILFTDKAKGQITCMGQQYLVFSDKTFTLDQCTINYQMHFECATEKCNVKVSAIHYLYQVGDKMERILAETQIVDNITFNKKRDRMLKSTGKFRIKTIDLVESLFDGVEKALDSPTRPITQEVKQAVAQMSANPEKITSSLPSAGISTLSGYKQIAPDKIPGNIYKILSENWMLICGGNQEKFNMMTASWGGLGHLYNKPVSFCFINPTRYTFHLMENNNTYTLCFFTETYRELLNYCGSHSGKEVNKVKESGLTPIFTPSKSVAFSEAWMIIECKKLVGQQFNKETVFDSEALEKWGENLHKMYIGEIINVWVK